MTGSGPSLARTGALVRLALRRDRVRLPLWIAVAAGLVTTQSVSSQALYDSPQDLAAYEASVGSNAATIALAGPPVGLDSVAGAVAFEISAFVIVVTALMAVFTTGRHTRGDEEAGRTVQSGTLAEMRHLTRTSVTVETDRPVPGLARLAGVHDLRTDGARLHMDVDGDVLDDVVRQLAGSGVRSLVSTPPTLEELFLRHYGDELAAEGPAPALAVR